MKISGRFRNGFKIVMTVLLAGVVLSGPVRAGDTVPSGTRVVSLSPIITETIYLLGAEDALLANTQYCNVPPAAANKEKIGSVTHVNVEKIISLAPDLVITSALTREKQIQILKNQNVKVVEIKNPKTFRQMCELTLDIGRVLGRSAAAQGIVDRAVQAVDAVRGRVAGLTPPRVFVQIGLKPLKTVNKDLFIHEFIKLSNAVNITADARSWIYSREKVVQDNPDIILVATMGSSKKAGILEKNRWMGFGSMKAAATNHIYVLDPETICSPTPVSFAKGLADVAALIHPDAVVGVLSHE